MQMQMQIISMSQMVIVLGKFTLSGISNVSHYKYGLCIIGQHMKKKKKRNAKVRLTRVCMSFMHIPQSQRDPVLLLCSILINPALTEWIWQVMYVLGPG